jgi:hypothetical protein
MMKENKSCHKWTIVVVYPLVALATGHFVSLPEAYFILAVGIYGGIIYIFTANPIVLAEWRKSQEEQEDVRSVDVETKADKLAPVATVPDEVNNASR